MLVYASAMTFAPPEGPAQIIRHIAGWMTAKGRQRVDPQRLSEGVRDLVLREGQHVRSQATFAGAEGFEYPFLFCAQFSHADDVVSGRRWVTEIGLRQQTEHAMVDCTFLLRTDEVSARVLSPIQVTRPKLIAELAASCIPAGNTPGIRVKTLDEESAPAFLAEVEHPSRRSPFVLVSPAKNGQYMVSPARLTSLLVGIAEIVDVPVGTDTYAIEEIVGRRYGAWGGAINIIFPARNANRGFACETVLFRPVQLEDMVNEGTNIESEILSAVTHRTNLPYSWRHISLETVGHAKLRQQLAHLFKDASKTSDTAEYIELLEAADKELAAKDREVASLQLDVDEKSSEVRKLQGDIDGLKHALTGRQSSAEVSQEDLQALLPLREALMRVFEGKPSLSQTLTVIGTLFADRAIVLESAHKSAQDSDSDGFQYGKKAYDLLWKLVTGYWQALADGKGDQVAKSSIGHNAYAQNEGEGLSPEGRRRRTFFHHGRHVLMEKHLKIGVKDSAAATLRIHFEWVSDERRIVIGHCGKHLDF